MVDETRQSDIVEQAFESMRLTPPAQGPSLQALEQTLQAMRQAQLKPRRVWLTTLIALMERIKNMNKLIKYPIAAAFTLVVLAGAAYLLLGSHAGIAFADIRQQIEQTQTMTVTATSEMKVADRLMKMKIKMDFKSPGLMRMEQEIETPMPPNATTIPGATQPAISPTSAKSISIMDMNNQKGIALIPATKQAMTMDFKNVPPETLVKMKQQNFLDGLKKAVAGEHEELGEKKIGNQLAKGYRFVVPEMSQLPIEIWVDASTGNPLLIEQTLPDTMGLGKIKVTMTDFVMNPVLDDSLFDTNVPQGYSTLMNQSVDFNVKEEDLIQWLRMLADMSEGVFPKGLFSPSPKTHKHANTQASQTKPHTPENEKAAMQEVMAKMQPMQKALMFQMKMMQGGEFVYAGQGVKLGDKAAPILWYKAKDAKAYRVIYGDLHVEDADVAPQKPASQPATKPEGF
jgi:outer membrane lipoprotein-sorting protein